MKWRRACAGACVVLCLASSGCANPQMGAGNTTSSLGNVVNSLTVSFKPADERGPAWEDAVIARAIAAHEMRHP